MVLARALSLLGLLLLAACGARGPAPDLDREETEETTPEPDPGPEPGPPPEPDPEPEPEPPDATHLFLSGVPCPAESDAAAAAEQLSAVQTGQALALVEVYLVDECSGAGGQHVLMRELDGGRAYFLGDHACYFFGPELTGTWHYGVVRYTPTKALFSTPVGWCVNFGDGAEPILSDAVVEAVALFDTQDDAAAFLDAL